MFWFSRKRFSGSYLSFSATSRAYFSSPNVARTRSSPVSARNVSGAPAILNGSISSPHAFDPGELRLRLAGVSHSPMQCAVHAACAR